MKMEVIGRHALFFDDDASSSFVNSIEALVDWNSLLIDRYDVRHLLQSPLPPPPKLISNRQSEKDEEEFELDQIRYQDLPLSSSNGGVDADDGQIQVSSVLQDKNETEPANGGTYHAVSFSYGKSDASLESRDTDVPGFVPPFPVPESLLQSLPPTEKLHQIMARTAIFVSEHGGQSEIVLRVKQGNNPTFGFLIPDHYLHVYFRFLVDNPRLLKSDSDAKPEELEKGDQEKQQTDFSGGALSLLGSVYGLGEDEECAAQIVSEFKENKPVDASDSASGTLGHGLPPAMSSGDLTKLEVVAPQHPLIVDKVKGLMAKKKHTVNTLTSVTPSSKKKEGKVSDSLPKTDKSQDCAPNTSLIEHFILEPPSEIKRMMDKIAEYILRNGKEFEKVLIEQESSKGRFSFLLPSNQYYPYYLKTLQKALELKQPGSAAHKLDLARHIGCSFKDSDAVHDLPYDLERKEKFKMVITGSKKDSQEPAPKPSQQQYGMSVDAAAAILQAATRGMRNPKLETTKKGILDDSFQSIGSEGGPSSSFGTPSFTSKESSVPIPAELSRLVHLSKASSATNDLSVAKAIAKRAAIAAASEADSSEAGLTKEQKQKAERLKRAKMFAALIKSGAANQANELLPRLSAEPPDFGVSGLAGSGCNTDGKGGFANFSKLSDGSIVDIVNKEREGSSVPVDTSDRIEKSRKMYLEDDCKERSRRKQHFRSKRAAEEEEEEDDDDDERNHKHSKRRHHDHHSSHHSRDEHKHRRRHSSSKDRESRRRHKYYSSSEDDQYHTGRSYKHRASHSKRKIESDNEKGEKLVHKSDKGVSGKDDSRVISSNLVNDHWDGSTPIVEAQPSNATQVPDDLRAKVRAMLLATL